MIHGQANKNHLLIAPQAKTNSATASAALDCIDADYATIRIAFKSEINTNAIGPTISLLHSDDTVVTNHVTAVADRTAENITNAKVVVYHVDTKALKRYLRLTITTATATNDDITVSAVAETSRLAEGAGSTTDMVSSTNDAVVIV